MSEPRRPSNTTLGAVLIVIVVVTVIMIAWSQQSMEADVDRILEDVGEQVELHAS